jgi:hypothetical protein
MPRIGRTAAAVLSVAPLVLASCYSFATPSYHPGEARDLVGAIARQGVTVREAIPGDSACDDPDLVANAMRLSVTDPDGGAQRDVWLYSFRERSWATSQGPVDDCQAAFQAADPGAVVTRLDVPVYRTFGADWSTALRDAMAAGLADAAEAGQP